MITNLPNKYLAYNVLSVFAVAHALGLDWAQLQDTFRTFQLPEGRGQSIKVVKPEKTFHLYDDTYNANPLSMASAISSSSNIKDSKHRFLILGDMKELGTDEISYHLELKETIAQSQPGKVILCGELMKHLWQAIEEDSAFNHIKKGWYPSVEEIVENIDSWIEDDDHVILKASNSMGFKQVIDYFKE